LPFAIPVKFAIFAKSENPVSREQKIVTIITVAAALVFTGAIVWWHAYAPAREFALQLPGADNRPEGSSRSLDEIRIGEFFMRYGEETSSLTGRWPCFRGASPDNIARSGGIVKAGAEDYPIVWEFETGEGHAAPVIYNGMVYILDYDEKLNSDVLRCFSLESGRELWRRWYRVPMKRNHGFSRTAPAVNDSYVVTIGPRGHIMCCDRKTGALQWGIDMEKEYLTEVPFWYAGQCPRLENDVLVVAPAGKETLMAGISCATGKPVWETPNTVGYKMSHSSITPVTVDGKKMYVYAGIGGVCGVSAEGSDAGALLWHTAQWQPTVIAPPPVQISPNRIFLVAG